MAEPLRAPRAPWRVRALGALGLLWPLVEIYVFSVIGHKIGWLLALASLLLLSAFGVALLIRSAELSRTDLRRSGSLAAAGVLFVIPGFLSSALGAVLLLPGVQRLLGARAVARLQKYAPGGFPGAGAGPWGRAPGQPGAPGAPGATGGHRAPDVIVGEVIENKADDDA